MRANLNFQGQRVNSKLTMESCLCFAPASSEKINKVQKRLVGAQDPGGTNSRHQKLLFEKKKQFDLCQAKQKKKDRDNIQMTIEVVCTI